MSNRAKSVSVTFGMFRALIAGALLWATPAAASIPKLAPAHSTLESPVSVEAAYREGEGRSARLVVILSSTEEHNHPELASGNRVFYGDDQDLWQLDASVPGELGAVETELAFFRGVEKGSETLGSLTLSPVGARVVCSPAAREGTELARLDAAAQADLERRLAAGTARLHALPGLLEPLYLFTPSAARERAPSSSSSLPPISGSELLVLVEGPVFNFHGDYKIEIGSRRHLSDVAISSDFRTWRVQRAGEIRFATGGGLYIPLTIDLMPKSDRDHRGAPTLIRDATAELETLEVPRLPRAELAALGFGKPEFARLHTPCDAGLDGAVAQVAPRLAGR